MNQVRNRASARAQQTSALASRGAPDEIVEDQHVAHIGIPAIIGPAVKARPSLARLPCKNPMLGLYGETVDGELGGVCVVVAVGGGSGDGGCVGGWCVCL